MEAVLDVLYNYVGEISAFVLGLGVIATAVSKGKVFLTNLIDLLQEILHAFNDGKLEKDEITKIIEKFNNLASLFKAKK